MQISNFSSQINDVPSLKRLSNVDVVVKEVGSSNKIKQQETSKEKQRWPKTTICKNNQEYFLQNRTISRIETL